MNPTLTPSVIKILGNYASETPGVRANLVRLLHHGVTGGTGKLLIYAVDQGFEHGPMRSFPINDASHDPLYHFRFAQEAGLTGFAAPLGLLEMGAADYAGTLPLILKMNSSNTLVPMDSPDQAVTASVDDALRLGCAGIGFTLYPGSGASLAMLEDLREITAEAKAKGLVVVVWSYARGNMSAQGETAVDIVSYGAHMACLMGAHIVKVKVPTPTMETSWGKEAASNHLSIKTTEDAMRYVIKSAFEGRRLVIFSGGVAKGEDALLEEVKLVCKTNGAGSIIGRNMFQRPYEEALDLAHKMGQLYKG